MKSHFIKIIFLVLLTLNVAAQNPKSGIYKTFSDYNNNKISYKIDCKIKNRQLHDAISAQFQKSDISDYDTFHKMFKVNHITEMSK